MYKVVRVFAYNISSDDNLEYMANFCGYFTLTAKSSKTRLRNYNYWQIMQNCSTHFMKFSFKIFQSIVPKMFNKIVLEIVHLIVRQIFIQIVPNLSVKLSPKLTNWFGVLRKMTTNTCFFVCLITVNLLAVDPSTIQFWTILFKTHSNKHQNSPS